MRPTTPSVISDTTIQALHDAANAARLDWTMISALSGDGVVEALELAVASYLHTTHVVAVSSGTAALLTALVACKVEPGDEVILPSYTWGQTLGAVMHRGATPLFADIDPARLTIDALSAERLITPRTRAIIAVHMFGYPADVASLRSLADRHGIALIEDAAQAFGATVDGRAVGTFGDAAAFSLGREKLLTGGEGGLVVTNDRAVFERAVSYSQHPMRQRRTLGARFDPAGAELGLNLRIHPLAAVIARAELEGFAARLETRQNAARRVSEAMRDLPGLTTPAVFPGMTPAFWRVPLTWGPPNAAADRQALLAAFFRAGVPVGPDPVAAPLHKRWRSVRSGGHSFECPWAEQRCDRTGLVLASSVLEGDADPQQLRDGFMDALRTINL